MGIVCLPETRMYCEVEYQDSYVTQLLTRDRFDELQRYWHIALPTPAGVTHTVIDKTSPLYRDCQTYFEAFYTPGRDALCGHRLCRDCARRIPMDTGADADGPRRKCPFCPHLFRLNSGMVERTPMDE